MKIKIKIKKWIKIEYERIYKKNILFKTNALIILFLVFLIMNKETIEKIKFEFLEKKKHFMCLVSLGKYENRYAREFVEHYISIGVEKFFLGDDNPLGGEKLSDVLQDYIDKGFVEIKDVRGKNFTQEEFFDKIYKSEYYECKWMAFYDFDEFLVFDNKNMNLKEYLSMKIFNKCEVVKIFWLVYYDNDLARYDNRSLFERFKNPDYKSDENRFHKSIVRVKKVNGTVWSFYTTGPHQPNEFLFNMCDSEGLSSNLPYGILARKNYKFCHLNHYTMKTIEEYAIKMIRGHPGGIKANYTKKLKRIFNYNKFTQEKLQIIEQKLNVTFPQYHKKPFI